MRKKILLVITLCICSILGGGYYLSLNREQEVNMYEEYFKQEMQFLVFTPSEEPKEINIYYPEDISWISEEALAKAKLYQDNKCIDVAYTLKKGLKKNHLIIELSEFTPKFNRVVIDLEDKSNISLSMAQCYIENLNDLDELNDLSTWFAGNGHKQDTDAGVIIERSFTKGLNKEGLDGELNVFINNDVIEGEYIKESEIKVLSESDKQVNTQYVLQLNKDRLIQEGIYRVVIESVWIVENEEIKVNVLENKIPIRIK